jgi:hypothetical protein
LILTFDRPIDGASFIFDPFCPDPLPGVVEDPLNPGKPEDPVGTDEAQTFRFNNRAYGFLPTDSNTKAGDQIFSVFAVTVRYDANFDGDPGPGILWGLPEAPLSFWQGKASKQGFGFAGVDGFLPAQDSLSAPEPASIVELALGVCALVLLRRYFNSVRNQRTSQCNP